MKTSQKILLGFLTFVILTASVYFIFQDNLRIDVQKTKTTFQVYENGSWILAGTEYTKIYDGTTLMRANERVVNYTVDTEKNISTVWRYAYFKENITAIDTYQFDGTKKDVELFPISHEIKIINGKGKILHYEVNDLIYKGETKNEITSPQAFGHKMKVEWQDGNYYSKIFKYKNKDVGKLTIRYRVDSEDYSVNVRLFDPSQIGDWTGDSFSISPASNSYGMTNDNEFLWFIYPHSTISDIHKFYINGTDTGETWPATCNGNNGPHSITQNGTNFWVGNALSGSTICVYDMSGNYQYNFSHSGSGISGADSMVISSDSQTLYLGDRYGLDIRAVSPIDGSYLGFTFNKPGSSNNRGMDLYNGYFFITDPTDDRVYIVYENGTDTGNYFETAFVGNDNPFGITLNDSRIWVGDLIDDLIYVYYNEGQTQSSIPPTYSNFSYDNNISGEQATFSLFVSDEESLAPRGQYIFSTNNTGVWVNDSAVNFTMVTGEWANVTKTLNSTGDLKVGFRWFLSDNAGNINNTPIYTLTTVSTNFSIQITDPTTENPKSVSDGDNITINFNFLDGESNVTSGITLGTVLIGGEEALIVQSGTPPSFVQIDYEDFEGYSEGTQPNPIGNWTQATFDTDNWYVYTGNGESSSTGPTANYDGYYAMVETSSGACNNPDTAVLYRSPEIDFNTFSSVNVSFAYNMYGSTMGTLHIKENSTGTWISRWNLSGDQGTSWFTEDLELSELTGSGNIAIWMDCGNQFTSDAAVDSVNISGIAGGISQEFGYVEGVGWQVNVTTPAGAGLEDLFLNATYNAITKNDTQSNAINYGAIGTPDINYTLNLPTLRFLNCSPDWENADSRPDGQTSTLSAINATNNGTATGNFKINLTGSLNTGWTIYASNDSLVNNITLSTSAQTIWSDVGVGETKQIWLKANCSYVSANPGQSISLWAV